jgi:hypothetical protein
MSYESPSSILYDVRGIEMAVSGGIAVPVSTSALLFAGMTTTGTASYLKTETDGTLWVTGSFSTTLAGVTTVTGTVAIQGLTNVSGALPVFISASNTLTVTGTITVGNQPTVNQGNSGSFQQSWKVVLTDGTQVLGTGSTAPFWITGSVAATIPGTVTVTGSVSVLNTVTVQGTVTSNQGNSGSIAQSWYTTLTDGTKTLGTGSSAPLFVENAVHTGSLITAVAATTSVVALVPSSSQVRRGVTIYNDTNKSMAVLYGSGTVNTTNKFSIKVAAGGYLEIPEDFTGPIYAVWTATAAGSALVTEFYP